MGSELARPPARPPGTRRLCVVATQGHCVIATQGPRVCWLGPEHQGIPNHTFLSPNGSPWHHLGLGDREPTQNFGANLASGGPPPQSQLLFSPFWNQKCQNVNVCRISENGLPQPGRIWAPMGPMGPKGPMGAPWGPWGPPWAPPGAQGAPMGPHREDFPIALKGLAAWPKAFKCC